MLVRAFCFLIASALSLSCVYEDVSGQSRTNERIVGGGEGTELVFVGLPAQVPQTATIAPPAEPGERLRLTGTVKDDKGSPIAGVIVYAYQTDANGTYPRAETRHGRLRGWSRTDRSGKFAFETVRPGGYPGSDAPQHIHMHVIEPGRCTYWISDVMFTDDPRLVPSKHESRNPRGGSGIVTPAKTDGKWHASRDITLGLNVPGWPGT